MGHSSAEYVPTNAEEVPRDCIVSSARTSRQVEGSGVGEPSRDFCPWKGSAISFYRVSHTPLELIQKKDEIVI